MTRVKTSAQGTGRDNRTPFVGGTQFPTANAIQPVMDRLEQSKGKAEVGPAPLMGKLDKSSTSTIKSQSVKMLTPAGMLPKLGADMSDAKFENDPLIKYLRKEAAELETNADSLPTQKLEDPVTMEAVDFSTSSMQRKMDEQEALMKSLFQNYPGVKGSR